MAGVPRLKWRTSLDKLFPKSIINRSCVQILPVTSSRTDKKQTNDAMNAVFEEWLTAANNEGIELAEEAKFRLVMYCYAQSTFGFNFLELESFWKAYRRLQELEAFAPATVTVIEKSAAPQKAVPETLEELDGSTREGLKKMRRLTENATWGNDSDYAAVIDAWLASLVEFFDFRPTTAQKKLAIDWIIKMNLPLHSPKSFDSARRHLTKSGQWPQGMLLPAEQLDDTIENWRALHPGASDWEERTELRRLQKVFLGQV
jgi:hypothetical protein